LEGGYRDNQTLQLKIATDYSQIYEQLANKQVQAPDIDIDGFRVNPVPASTKVARARKKIEPSKGSPEDPHVHQARISVVKHSSTTIRASSIPKKSARSLSSTLKEGSSKRIASTIELPRPRRQTSPATYHTQDVASVILAVPLIQ
jgi:hypothetical protein